MRKLHFIILFLTVVFGSYLRLYNLGLPSFWVDELDFVAAAKSQITTGEPLLASGYAYPRTPILTTALSFIYPNFGVSEFTSRAPSAVCGILSILMIYWIGSSWFGRRAGLFAAIFLAVAPFEVGWSRACRMYAVFQLTFLAGMFFFYRGFEAGSRPQLASGQLRGFKKLLSDWQLNLPMLALGGFFLLLSYTCHQNAGLFLFTFLVYLLVMVLYEVLSSDKNLAGRAFGNRLFATLKTKYGVLFGLSFLGLLIAIFLPPIRAFLSYAAEYQPKWAEVASAQNQWRILEFLIDSQHFPVYALAAVGAVLVFKYGHRPGIFSFMNLAVPVLLFTFVFQYRKNDYVYHVYPVLFLLAGFGLSEIAAFLWQKLDKLRQSFSFLKNQWRGEVALLALCLFWVPLTPGFRFAQKIPRLPDGSFNGAIYHNEWKEAAAFLQNKIKKSDILVSTLPLSVQYYLGRADYNLNWSNSDLAHENNIVAPDGRFIDLYSGADLIESAAQLQKIMSEHSGWFLADAYRFEHDVYVPANVRELIKSQMQLVLTTAKKTVVVYEWKAPGVVSSTN